MARTLRTAALLMTALLLLGLPAAYAAPIQEETGSILVPIRAGTDPTYSSWPGGHRRAYIAASVVNGVTGYTFEVEKATWDRRFTLEVTDLTGSPDADITFYSDLTTPMSTGGLQTRRVGGETDFVPPGTTHAIVTLFSGASAQIVFRALPEIRPPVRLPKMPALPKGLIPNFGKGTSALAHKLKNQSHVVIAVIDTGINPYHLAYRSPGNVVHPSEYIDGYPKDAAALGLTFGSSYLDSRKADDGAVWSKVKERTLYWIPGTNIIGGYSLGDVVGDPGGGLKSRPIIDDQGHGTGTSSVAAGGWTSPTRKQPYGTNPEALIVIVENFDTEAMKWIAEQPWIDFVSGSYGDGLAIPYNELMPDVEFPAVEIPDPTDPAAPIIVEEPVYIGREYRHTMPFVLRDGRTACFSSGNGAPRGLPVGSPATVRYSSIRPTSGPSWVVTVGAVSPRNGHPYTWHNVPVDVSSYGLHYAAAAPLSVDGEQDFGGTSNATPVTCGVLSRALLEARRALGDTTEGIHATADGTPVAAIGRKGPGALLADGVLTRQELQDSVLKTAMPTPFDVDAFLREPLVIPDNPAYYTQEGYGIADMASAELAVNVVLGRAPMPDRAEVDQWIGYMDSLRNLNWPPATYEPIAPRPASASAPPGPPAKPKPRVLGNRHTLPSTGLPAGGLGVLIAAVAILARRRLSAL